MQWRKVTMLVKAIKTENSPTVIPSFQAQTLFSFCLLFGHSPIPSDSFSFFFFIISPIIIIIICGKVGNQSVVAERKNTFPFFILIIIIYSAPQSVIGCEQSKISRYKDFNLLHSEKLQMSNLSLICFSVFLNLLIDV